jgi:flagellum-specific peptidoglycan hydrolase FlgJ
MSSTNGSVFVSSPATLSEETAWPVRSDVFAEMLDVGAGEDVAADEYDNSEADEEAWDEYADESNWYAEDSPSMWSNPVDEVDSIGEAYLEEADWAAEYPADEWADSEDDFAPAEEAIEPEAFPSGVVLTPVAGPTGHKEEHWDPSNTGLPLYDTGPNVRTKKLSRSFTAGELASSGGRADDRARISSALVQCLQAIRDRAGRAVKITSGYRSWSRNVDIYRRAGKNPTLSRHCSGQAADIVINGMSGLQIAKLAIDSCGDRIGIGVGKTFAHIDVRGVWTVWTYDGLNQAHVQAELDAHRRGGRTSPTPKPPTPKSSGSAPAHVVEFVRKYRPHAQANEASTRIPWLVTLGQAALESAWGKRTCGNNMFGIKAKPSIPESQRKLCTTKEVHKTPNAKYPEVISVTPRPDGKYDYVVRDWFRAFASPEDSFGHHAKVLQHPRYAKAFAHTNDPYAFADEVAAGGYATAPNYAPVLKSVMKLIEKVP